MLDTSARTALLRHPAYRAVMERAEEDLSHLSLHFEDAVERTAGYIHDFVCPVCAKSLFFDPVTPHAFGGEYHCSACGKTVKGELYDAAWVTLYRQDTATRLKSLSLLALAGNGAALSALCRILDFYAENYDRFPVHGKHAGRGKITEQCLDEAVLAICFLEAIFPIKHLLTAKQLSLWGERLFFPLCRFLNEQTDFCRLHNIKLWMLAAVGMTAILFEDHALLDNVLNAPFGIRDQVKRGYTADGLWFEGSFHYHYYATEALTRFLYFYRQKQPNDALFAVLEKCYRLPMECMWDGLSLPALNDGWYPMRLYNYAPQLLVAAAILRDGAAAEQVRLLSGLAPDTIYTTHALLLGLCPDGAQDGDACCALPLCSIYPDTSLAVLRRPFYAILRGGSVTQNHMHADFLSLSVYPFSEDLGTPGYGHPLCDGFYRRSIAHNTVCVDGKSQPLQYFPTPVTQTARGAETATQAVFPGITASRRVEVTESGALFDLFCLTAREEHTYDWFFHIDGELIGQAEGTPVTLAEATDGYEHLTELSALGMARGRVLRFATKGGIVALRFLGDGALFLGKTPHNPSNQKRYTLLVRAVGTAATFRTEISRE